MPVSKRILIVEDEQAIRDTLSLMLQMEGYEILTASNGKEALELLSKVEAPALILLDLMMPVMNGFEFAAAVGQDKKTASIPIVLLSAFTEHADRVKNARYVLTKPIEFELFSKAVREFCG